MRELMTSIRALKENAKEKTALLSTRWRCSDSTNTAQIRNPARGFEYNGLMVNCLQPELLKLVAHRATPQSRAVEINYMSASQTALSHFYVIFSMLPDKNTPSPTYRHSLKNNR